MNDPVAYSLGLTQGTADAITKTSSPTPLQYEDDLDYAAGYAQGNGAPSGPVSEPAPTAPADVYAAGRAHGLDDRANRSSSPVPPEHEDSKEYAQGYAEADPPAYAAGVETGRSDHIHARSSATPPEYEGNEAYAAGYAEGLKAAPYISDVEAERKAEADARMDSMPKLPRIDLTIPLDVTVHDGNHPRAPSMSPATPGEYPPRPPAGEEDGEMPHGEYGPERPGQEWDPKSKTWKYSWELYEENLKTGEGEGEVMVE